MMMPLLLAAVLQAAPPPPPRPPQPSVAELSALSAPGQAIVARAMEDGAAADAALRERTEAARRAVLTATQARPIDVSAVERALAARDALEAERLAARSRSAVVLLRQLSPTDQIAVADLLAGPPGRPPRGDTPPGGPPPRR